MLVYLRPKKVTGKAAEKALDRAGITVNKPTIPFDPEKPFVASGIRLGTPALTTRGMKEDDMRAVAGLIDRVIVNIENEEVVTSFVLCPLTTLQILFNYLKDATKGTEISAGDVDDISAQVAMLVYSGMDSHAIEKMVNISHKDIEKIYDKLIGKGLVEVVMTRREVKLTTKGVRFVNEAVKT